MSFETPQYSENSQKKLAELRWQKEMIERWAYSSRISTEALAQVREMLSHVDYEEEELKAKRYMD